MTTARAKTLLKCVLNVAKKRPILAIFDITKHCNQHCLMCNIPKKDSSEMKKSEIENLALRLRKFGIGYVFIQGGEPLLRKDIIPIADIFIANGIKPTIITNGVFLTKELARELSERKCNVSVSIDSLKPEKYFYLRGSDDLSKVLDNLRDISGIKKNRGNWSVTSTITGKSELADIKAVYDFASDYGFMFAIRPYVSVLGTAGRRCDDLLYDEKKIIDIFDFFYKKTRKENFLASIVYKYHMKYIRGESMPACDALNYSFFVKETGDISPCIEYPDIKVDINNFKCCKKNCVDTLNACNKAHPCFYNDAREIGIIIRNIHAILLHSPQIIYQMIKYGNFF